MSLRPSERAEMRRNRYKVAVEAEEGRRRREDSMVEIRKSRREESLLKKRRDGLPPSAAAAAAAPQMAHSSALQQKLEGLLAMVQAVLLDDSIVQLEATTQFRKLLSIVTEWNELQLNDMAYKFVSGGRQPEEQP